MGLIRGGNVNQMDTIRPALSICWAGTAVGRIIRLFGEV